MLAHVALNSNKQKEKLLLTTKKPLIAEYFIANNMRLYIMRVLKKNDEKFATFKFNIFETHLNTLTVESSRVQLVTSCNKQQLSFESKLNNENARSFLLKEF